MKILNWSPYIVLLSAIILAGAILLAPGLKATAAPPSPQVEVAAPLPLPVAPVPRDGFGIIAFDPVNDPPWPKQIDIPVGVALTDVLVYSSAVPEGDNPCEVWVYDELGEFQHQILVYLRPENNSLEASELHLESGLQSTEARPISLKIGLQCRARVFWTGYEY